MKAQHPITMEILNQHLVALGKTGSGKSSVMRVIIEQLLDAKKRVCIIDIKGDWYGLKLGADGKSPGYEIITFGDFKNPDATDIHINENHGAEIAKLIVNGNRPCIIGFRGWMPSKVHKFWIDFISTLYNGNKSPLWLGIDEVHNYTPKGKVLSPEIGNSIYWTNKLATEGRGIGLRLISASQRPQKVHNDFLANCETLVAMRVTHPSDKEAFHEWLKEYSDDNARGNLVLDSVSKMKTGEAFVWSPEAGLFERLKFPMFKTYDSFASPKEGKQRSLKGWASVNLEEVQASLSKVIEESKENDPKELKKRIRELELSIKKIQQDKIPTHNFDESKKQDEYFQKKVAEITYHYEQQYNKFSKEVSLIKNAILKNTGSIKQAVQALEEINIPNGSLQDEFKDYGKNFIQINKRPALAPTPQQPVIRLEQHQATIDTSDDKLVAGALRMLSAVTTIQTGLTMHQVKVLGNISDPSTFSRYKSILGIKGYWREDNRKFYPTNKGLLYISSCGMEETPIDTSKIVELWMGNLVDGARRMLKVLISYEGSFISAEKLMQEANINDPSTYSRYKSMLTTTHLAIVNGREIAANKETLFL
jgi:hypothetical protein